MRSAAVVLLLGTAMLFGCRADDNSYQNNHYVIDLKMDPEARWIRVTATLQLIPLMPIPEHLELFLHKQFTVHRVSGQGVENFSFDKETPSSVRWMPEGRVLSIDLGEKAAGRKKIQLEFEYEGTITDWPGWSANVITEDWVELGLYLPWFPHNQEYGPFTFEIEAECPPLYHLGSLGGTERRGGRWRFKWMSPTTDIVLAASKNLKTITVESNAKRINIHYSLIREKTADALAGDLIEILDFYETCFGGDKEGEITLIESLRERGGGYARAGLISLAGLSDDAYFTRHEAYIRYLAHEAGHVWWFMAPSDNWEDWMNEGLAEYSALMAIRELFGQETFDKRLEGKRNSIEGTPPIWGFDRNDRSTPEKSQAVEAILYSKGPVLLYLLEQRIGKDGFRALCRDMVKSGTASTEDLLALIRNKHGAGPRDWFEKLLKSF